MNRRLSDEAHRYKKMINRLINDVEDNRGIAFDYKIKLWRDNTITLDITRLDTEDEDGDDVYIHVEGNASGVYAAAEGWLNSEVNR